MILSDPLKRLGEGPEECNLFTSLLVGNLDTAIHALNLGLGDIVTLSEHGKVLTRLAGVIGEDKTAGRTGDIGTQRTLGSNRFSRHALGY